MTRRPLDGSHCFLGVEQGQEIQELIVHLQVIILQGLVRNVLGMKVNALTSYDIVPRHSGRRHFRP